MQPNVEPNFAEYFREYGCTACGRKDAEYARKGLCKHCYKADRSERRQALRRRSKRSRTLSVAIPPDAITISQRDLIEERLLTIDALKANRALHAKRDEIRRRLESGVRIEEGNHFAELSFRQRRNGKKYFGLVVR